MSPAVKTNKMESTVRIDYSDSPSTPVIKIINPKQLHEDSDPKDKLVESFLFTSSVADRNQLFYLANHFPLETPYKLSIIAPLHYFTELEKLREHIERRVMAFDSVLECHEFYDNNQKLTHTKIDYNIVVKAPSRYGDYLKIKDFFDWIESMPYVEKNNNHNKAI